MRKRVLKGVLCTMLSVVMATGGVVVGAKPKQMSVTESIQSVANINATKTESTKIISNKEQQTQARTSVLLNNAVVPTVWDTKVKSLNKSVTIENGNYIGSIVIKNAGTLVAGFGKEFCVRDNSNKYIKGSTNGLLYIPNMKPGTYYLYTKENTTITNNISISLYPNQNNRQINSKIMVIGGTGKDMYLNFKIKKKGTAIFQLLGEWVSPSNFGKTYGITNYIQKKSGSSWKIVTSSQYTTDSKGYASVYGLVPGTYRIVMKSTYQSGVMFATYYKQITATDSYGTSKKKAKTISRKKAKKQTFVATDSTKTEHWYKINVSKKRTTYIDVTSLGSTGDIYCTVYGKARFNTKDIKNGRRYYLKAPKGTYYIRVKRNSKRIMGSYQVKYTK